MNAIAGYSKYNHVYLGDHVCSFFDNNEEQGGVVCPYALEALNRNERFIYVYDRSSRDETIKMLSKGGIDVSAGIEKGQIVLVGPDKAYLRTNGDFDVEAMLAFWGEQVQEAKSLGFAGVKAAAEMSWALGGCKGGENLAVYEAKLNDIFPHSDVTAICQYDVRLFPEKTLKEMLLSHHIVITGTDFFDNKFFDPGYRGGPLPEKMMLASFSDLLGEVKTPSKFVPYPDGSGYRTLISEKEYEVFQLKDKLETIQLYLDILLHDVNNINIVAKGYAEMLLEDLEGRNRTLVGNLARNIDHNLEIIRNISTMVRLGESCVLVPVDLNEVIMKAKSQFPEVDITHAPTQIMVWADGLIEDIFHNLIGNSQKFSEGGVKIWISTDLNEGWARVILEDDGPGISDEDKARIFDRYYRANGKKNGKGLGLAIVKALVERYEGRISVEDRIMDGVKKGCRFDILFRPA